MISHKDSEIRVLHEEKDVLGIHLGKYFYAGNKVVDLGSSNRYNIASLLPNDYQNLTEDNFFFLDFGTGYANAGANVGLRSGMTKTYYNSGTLLYYAWVQNKEFATHAVYVKRPNRLKHIGLGQTFDIKSIFPNSYQNLNVNNFLIKSIVHNNYIYSGDKESFNYIICDKTYDSENGVLTCRVKDQGASENSSWVRYSDCDVYFVRKAVE